MWTSYTSSHGRRRGPCCASGPQLNGLNYTAGRGDGRGWSSPTPIFDDVRRPEARPTSALFANSAPGSLQECLAACRSSSQAPSHAWDLRRSRRRSSARDVDRCLQWAYDDQGSFLEVIVSKRLLLSTLLVATTAALVHGLVLLAQVVTPSGKFTPSSQWRKELDGQTGPGIVAGRTATIVPNLIIRRRLEGPNNASVHR